MCPQGSKTFHDIFLFLPLSPYFHNVIEFTTSMDEPWKNLWDQQDISDDDKNQASVLRNSLKTKEACSRLRQVDCDCVYGLWG